MNNWITELNKFSETEESLVLISLVNVKGSSPQDIGAKAIVNKNGLIFGTVGGGKVEAAAILHAQKLIQENAKFDFKEWNLAHDIGMTCGGVASFAFEVITKTSPFKIAIFGAGHVGQELIRILLKTDCQIICVDQRLEWLNKLPENRLLKKVHLENIADYITQLPEDFFIVSLTMGHLYDLQVLTEALKKNFIYVGSIGSESKAATLKQDLKTKFSKEKIDAIHCPIGEKFGNNSPYEIALSITAELLRVRDEKIKL